MKQAFCRKCRQTTLHSTLVHNESDYQYTYEECKRCGHQILINKIPITKQNEDRLRTKKWI